jgi:mannose-6-phosphate isomerase-like protein (cupin superfamily)
MGEERVFQLGDMLSKIGKDEYFNDFLKIRDLEAGVIRLRPGQEDTQEPHPADELYYVVEGSGLMELGKAKDKPVKKGSIIFVPAGLHHRFYGNKEDLIVLYMFAG